MRAGVGGACAGLDLHPVGGRQQPHARRGSELPEAGSIRHSIGIWPLVIDDATIVEESEPPHRLVLCARLGPMGAARITMLLHEIPQGCRIEMIEVPVEGPMSLVPDSVALAAAYPRNKECLLRLAALAERLEPSQVK